MPVRAQDKKREVVAAAVALAHARWPAEEAPAVARFIEHYCRDVAAQDVASREPGDVYGAAVAHLRFGQRRDPETPLVRVYNPTIDRHGWLSTHTIVEVVNDDMPFLVDSASLELSRHGLGIHLVIHPIVNVRRDDNGVITDVQGSETNGSGYRAESYMHFEVDRQSDPEVLADMEQDISRVLGDVRRAVTDWRAMSNQVETAIADCQPPSHLVEPDQLVEIEAFLRWIADEHFTFLGYASYDLTEGNAGLELAATPGSQLGILRGRPDQDRSRSFQDLPIAARERARDARSPLLITKANSKSTVHRASYLDVIGVKRYRDGGVVGEHRFLGLFTSVAYHLSPRDIPLLRRKVDDAFRKSGHRRGTHAGKALIHILETYPRDELFQTDEDELGAIAHQILHLQDRQQLRLFLRRDPFDRFVSCLVYIPRDRYNTSVRERMESILLEALDGGDAEFQAQLSDEVLARILFTIRTPRGARDDFDADAIEAKLGEASFTWTDRLREALHDAEGEEEGNRLFNLYGRSFPVAYQERIASRAAIPDIRHLEELSQEGAPGLAMTLYRRLEDPREILRFRLIRRDAPVLLSDALPILEDMGLKVLAEEAYSIRAQNSKLFSIHDFMLEPTVRAFPQLDDVRQEFEEAFADVWSEASESDGFNRLVLAAGLSSRQIIVLRGYCKYLLQLGIPFSQTYIEQTLVGNGPLAASLVDLFEAKFLPGLSDRAALIAAAEGAIEAGLEQVAILDEDRIIRSFLGLIQASLRTNWFQTGSGGERRRYLSFKLDPARVPGMPQPRPAFEIFVYSPRVEGVHLRGGKVARGGLRWSDRREDFRTEVLGLMKAQMVKNSVIVPVGAKGGFYVKRPPVGGDRAAVQEEAIKCYKTFLHGLLDITDNRLAGGIESPPNVVRYDDDDPYLVVAADKGTATFSDIANGVSLEYGFWLKDAFASGGSAGYDHKAMGITAKGAWESVRRHFREMGRDPQLDPFTVVGVGDMSGDVFGNGMLLSDKIRLIAAFDHRHIFIDPDPDPASSFAERQRLFALPRSSWADYDTSKLSPGGGIYPRTAKSIGLSPSACAALDLQRDRFTPSELINAILKAPVDLLWNGGIGTYVKAAAESHADAQDRSNDTTRVNGEELRCKIVGEGGNLGLTQRGRVAFAQRGGRINTDFIDNSAGVDCSDHEVNIKILLGEVVANGDLTIKQRNELLAAMTDEVGELVLRDNILQNIALSTAQSIGTNLVDAELRLMRKLERSGLLDRSLEMLPSNEEIAERRKNGSGLTRPESAVLLAYSKMLLFEQILASEIPDRVYFAGDLAKYFPRKLRRRYASEIQGHRLRREIIATWIANSLCNRGLHVFVSELEDQIDAGLEEIVLGYVIARDSFGLIPLWGQIEGLPLSVPSELQLKVLIELRHVLMNGARWFIAHGGRPLGIRDAVGRFKPRIAQVVDQLNEVLSPRHCTLWRDSVEGYETLGIEPKLARAIGALPYLLPASDIVMAVEEASAQGATSANGVLGAARIYFAFDQALEVEALSSSLHNATVRSRWDRLALNGLSDQLASALRRLTVAALSRGLAAGDAESAEVSVREFLDAAVHGVERYRSVIEDVRAIGELDLAPLSVAVRALSELRPLR